MVENPHITFLTMQSAFRICRFSQHRWKTVLYGNLLLGICGGECENTVFNLQSVESANGKPVYPEGRLHLLKKILLLIDPRNSSVCCSKVNCIIKTGTWVCAVGVEVDEDD